MKLITHHSAFFCALAASFVMAALIAPELVTDRIDLMKESFDRGYVSSFAFINDFLNGGIQLWNRFNQLPYAWVHATVGFYDLHKFFASLYFLMFPPGPNVGADFRIPFMLITLGLTFFLRTLGFYLLLSRFTSSKTVLVLATLYGNVFFSFILYTQLVHNDYLSFQPLIIHLILKFFETRRIRELCWGFIVFAMSFSFNPYNTLNYIYATTHFLVISCIVVYYFVFGEYGMPYRKLIRQVLGEIVSGLPTSVLDWLTKMRRHIRLLVLDGSGIFITFSLVFSLRAVSQGLPLTVGNILTPGLAGISVAGATLLVFNVLFGLYTNYSRETTISSLVRIILAGWTGALLLSLFPVPGSRVWLAAGYALSVAFFVLVRYGRLRRTRDLAGQLAPLVAGLFRWIPAFARDVISRSAGRRTYVHLAAAAVLGVVFLLPFALMYAQIFPGIAYDTRRMENLGLLTYMFKPNHLAWGGISAFPYLSVDYLAEQWSSNLRSAGSGLPMYAGSYQFLGLSTLFFAIVGVVMARDRRKYVFLFTFLSLLFLNWNIPLYLNPFHWINVISNPFSFTNRTFHGLFTVYSLIFLTPLIALGMQGILDHMQGSKKEIIRRTLAAVAIASISLVITMIVYSATITVYLYLMAIIVAFLAMIALMGRPGISFPARKALVLGIMAAVFLVDSFAFAQYVRAANEPAMRTPLTGSTLGNSSFADTVSPRVLPVREFFSNRPFAELKPDAGTDQDKYQGMYYQFADLYRFRLPIDTYFARPAAYAPIAGSPVYSEYLARTNRLFIRADWAVAGNETELSEIVRRGMTDKVVILNVDGVEQDSLIRSGKNITSLPLVQSVVFNLPVDARSDIQEIAVPLASARSMTSTHSDFELFIADSASIPQFMGTAIFTQESQRFRAAIGNKELSPVQGEVTRPFSFDINNVVPGAMVFSLPRDFPTKDATLRIEYDSPFRAGIVDVFMNTNDNLGIVVKSASNGWLLYHSPFDRRWQVTINGQPSAAYRANGVFMAVPIETGVNQIEFSYLPGSPIRPLIWLSLVTSMIVVVYLVSVTLLRSSSET